MKFGSVCSGIEAASVAFAPLGWKAAWFSEIEPFPCAVLSHHYPDVPNLGDMTSLPLLIKSGKVEAPDLLCGGTPCQAFSVAGLRNSLDDARGNLSLTFCEIANEIDAARSILGLEPAIILWENVPGVLSTKDNAFGCFLAGLAGEDDPLVAPGGRWTNAGCVFGPKRSVAWRILDAQYFGVAQRRRRVFVVAGAGDRFDPTKILFEFDGLRRDSAPSRESGQTVAPTIRAGAANGGPGHGARSGDSKDELIVPVAKTLRAQPNASNREDTDTYIPAVAGTMKSCKDSGGWSNSADHAAAGYMIPVGTLCVATGQAGADTAPTLNCNHEAPYAMYQTAHTLRGEGFDASEDGTGRGTPLVPVSYGIRTANTSSNGWGIQEEATHTLDRAMGVAVAQPIPFDTTQCTSKANRSNPKPGDPCHPLAAQAHVPCIAFPERMSGTQCASTENLAPSMGALNPTAVAVSLRGREGGATAELGDEVGNCLRASGGGGGDKPHILNAMQVRRLTPLECERLMGFPDGYTNVQHRNKPAADGNRYKALGNSWAIPCVFWIGRRIEQVQAIHIKSKLLEAA